VNTVLVHLLGRNGLGCRLEHYIELEGRVYSDKSIDGIGVGRHEGANMGIGEPAAERTTGRIVEVEIYQNRPLCLVLL
jgi:hypothetical protein